MVESLEKEVENYNSELKLTKAKHEDIINKTKDIVSMDISTIDEEIKSIQNNKRELESKLRDLHSIIDNNKTMTDCFIILYKYGIDIIRLNAYNLNI